MGSPEAGKAYLEYWISQVCMDAKDIHTSMLRTTYYAQQPRVASDNMVLFLLVADNPRV